MSKVNEKKPCEACKPPHCFRSHSNLWLLHTTVLKEKVLQCKWICKLSMSNAGNWEWPG